MTNATEKTILLTIVSTQKILFEKAVLSVSARGIEGELEILPGHLPLLTPLQPGSAKIRYIDCDGNKQEQLFFIASGTLEVQPDHITILADTGQAVDELDAETIAAAEHAIRQQITNQPNATDLQKAYLELAEISAKAEALRRLKKPNN